MRPIRDIDLMRLSDGELDADERAELEAAIAADPVARVKLEALGEVHEVVRGHLELSADDLDARLARMWGEVEKRMDLDAAPATAPAPVKGPGPWGRFSRWVDTYRGHVLTGALSAGAVAAIALMMRPEPEVIREPVVVSEAPEVRMPKVPDELPETDAVPVAHTPAAVESIDVADGTSTVFMIEDEDGEQTTVIWVTPDDTLEGI